MLSFFVRHKILTIFIIAIACYFFANKPHRFGIVSSKFVVFNRVPIAFLDLYIAPDGSSRPYENIGSKDAQKEIFEEITYHPHEDEILLIIGTGFKKQKTVFDDAKMLSLEAKNFRVLQVGSVEAIRLYNEAIDNNKTAALLLSIRN